MSNSKIKIIVFFFVIMAGIIWMLSPDKDAENKKKYLRSLSLNISGIVKQVMPLQYEDHGYGAIYLKNIISNKSSNYESAYTEKYLFCKIDNKEAIIVTPGITEINPDDSVVYNTTTLNYKIYRKNQLIQDNGIALNDDESFYNTLNINGYLDFKFYRKK